MILQFPHAPTIKSSTTKTLTSPCLLGTKVNRYFTLIALSLGLTGCETLDNFDVPSLPNEGKEIVSTTKLFDAKQYFVNVAIKAQSNSSTPTELMNYYDAGIMLSNRIFDEFFALHFRADRSTNHNKTLTNIVGGSAIGVLGLTGSDAKELALLGIGLAAVNSEFENYMAYFLISPSMPQIKRMMDTGRAEYAKKIRTALTAQVVQGMKLTYAQTNEAIRAYHQKSSRLEIQAIVSESIALAKYEVPDLSQTEEEKKQEDILSQLNLRLTKQRGLMSLQSAKDIYALHRAKTHVIEQPEQPEQLTPEERKKERGL